MEKGRRRHVPAFGEWNYYYHYNEPEVPAVPAACYAPEPEPEPEACSDVWFRYSPPPRKPTPKKMRRPRPDGDAAAPVKGGRRARPAFDSGSGVVRSTTTAKAASNSRVVRPVDEDLYQVPPPEFASHRPRRKVRSLWMGCLGLNSCVA
ncbi:uncharacterized protein LOC100842519 [Brachypodium distachyon]|uniref:Uncharacterized protein n=1 Tax=Brachypodium distachyon TaxID=15368 RepID=I1IXE3_BRADI|nr:uncharacterized protein LOC100842519 [Brachypodium distachyon]KQJ82449.1 hypothetical protein BRADI_5g09010v3 [Brachypodium distachyon]|eukprot:XP_010239860.1 uncharacterized protein LOC100842519 [Brachypodium distachyon]